MIISTPSSLFSTTALPATSPQPSPSSLQKTTAGDSPAKDGKKKLGLILGLSIPAVMFAIAAIFLWIRRVKSKKRNSAAEAGDEQKITGLRKERLSNIPEEGGGCSGYNNNVNKEKASSLSELHSDSIAPYPIELPGTPAPQLIELPGWIKSRNSAFFFSLAFSGLHLPKKQRPDTGSLSVGQGSSLLDSLITSRFHGSSPARSLRFYWTSTWRS